MRYTHPLNSDPAARTLRLSCRLLRGCWGCPPLLRQHACSDRTCSRSCPTEPRRHDRRRTQYSPNSRDDVALGDPAEDVSVNVACRRVWGQLGINVAPLRGWVRQVRIDTGTSPGHRSDDRTKICELEREVRELRRANSILKSASAFVAAETRGPPAGRRLGHTLPGGPCRPSAGSARC